jgi:uncharacterized protein (TIGR03437 family)
LLMALSAAYPAPAQTTVTHLAVQTGNGQVACLCLDTVLQYFQPISVKATDANGNPVSGATIAWTVTSGQMTLGIDPATKLATTANCPPGSMCTTTVGDGTSTIAIDLIVVNNFSSSAVPYLVNTIQAVANNNSNNTVTFTETQSLLTTQGNSVIQANSPTFNGADLSQANLSEPVATQLLSTPIQVDVAGVGVASTGVNNVAVRIFNTQTSPTLTCANNGGYADPGSVLTTTITATNLVTNGVANCFPVFNGSGTGTFWVTVGGAPETIPGDPPLDIHSTYYLQAFGPYTFTSIAGAPATFQIVSGNNQVASVSQPLSQLVARLVDSAGYPVQNQTVTWTVVPAGAAALTNPSTVTDNNGEVSTNASLYLPASAGCLITVALASNPTKIYATFQETIAGAITTLSKISGDGQSAQTATNFSQPLVVQVNNASGPVQNYPVQFTIGPAGPQLVSFPGGSTVGTNANGQAALTVTAGLNAGTATVTAVVGILTQTFTLKITTTPNAPPPNGLSAVSGTPQTAIVGQPFTQPLVVQVNSTAGPVSGYVVSFSSSGPVNISSGAATTGGNGQASINVQAGANTGTATVTASIPGGFTATFNLTVAPIGPSLSSGSFLNAASRVAGAISPCSLAIITAAGLTPDGISDLSPAPIFGRLPHSVHNLSITFGGIPAPIVSVAMGSTNPEVTVQVPCEVTPGNNVPVTVNVGVGSTTTSIAVQTVSPGIFQTIMSDGVSRAVVVRDDGTFADVGGNDAYDPNNPARRGENIRIYATGLGTTIPFVDTDNIQNPNADLIGYDANVAGVMQVGIVGFGGLQVVSARQAPDLIGVYEVQVLLPANAPTGNNVQIAIAVVPTGSSSSTPAVSSIAALIPIE